MSERAMFVRSAAGAALAFLAGPAASSRRAAAAFLPAAAGAGSSVMPAAALQRHLGRLRTKLHAPRCTAKRCSSPVTMHHLPSGGPTHALAATLAAGRFGCYSRARCLGRFSNRWLGGTLAHGSFADDSPQDAGMTSSSSSDSSSEESDDSGAERRRRVASITTHVSAAEVTRRDVVSRAEQTQSRRGDPPETAASRDERAFQKQAAVLLHRYLDQLLDTAAPEAAAAAGGGDHEDAGADFRVFASVPRGAPVVSGHGLLVREVADDGAGRVSRSEARRRARPRKRLQSDSDDEEKVIARANQVAVDAANIVAAAARAAATAEAQLQACRANDSDEDAVVVIDRTSPPCKARPPAPPASGAEGDAVVASGPKLSQRAKKKAKQLAAAQLAACPQ